MKLLEIICLFIGVIGIVAILFISLDSNITLRNELENYKANIGIVEDPEPDIIPDSSPALSGKWRWKMDEWRTNPPVMPHLSSAGGTASLNQRIMFTSNGHSFYDITIHSFGIKYLTIVDDLSYQELLVYFNFGPDEYVESLSCMDFGSIPQTVSPEFYAWFVTLAAPVN